MLVLQNCSLAKLKGICNECIRVDILPSNRKILQSNLYLLIRLMRHSSHQKKIKPISPEQSRDRQRNFNRTLVFYTIVVTKHTILSSAPTKDTNPPQSIDIIMRNREKLLLWNEKRKFVIRRRFPPLLFLSLSLLEGFERVRERLPLVLRAGLFLSMLATLFSLLWPAELGLSCLFEWSLAPLHGG